MSATEPHLFPLPRTGSQPWRSYWTQRRENGYAETHCPDIVAEAEKLFEISYGDSLYSYNRHNEDSLNISRDTEQEFSYRSLQRLQDKDWARSLAESAFGTIDECNSIEVLKKLNRALLLDPECILALQQRATVYIKQHELSRAKADIEKLCEIHKSANSLLRSQKEHEDDTLWETINSLYTMYRDQLNEAKAESISKGKNEYKRREAHASADSSRSDIRRSADRSRKGRRRRHEEPHSHSLSNSRNGSSNSRYRSVSRNRHKGGPSRSSKRSRKSS